MATPLFQQSPEAAACSDEDIDWEQSSQHSNEIDDAPFAHIPYAEADWQKQWPLQFSMNASVKAAGTLGEPRNNAKWAMYQDTAILDASGARGEEKFIRLLRIEAGTGGEPLLCQLVKRPLWDAGDYYALSYSWGTEPPSSEIYVESRNTSGFLFPVTVHLFSALKRLRNQHSVMHVWIDAICINQSNVVERAAQVQIMAQIFNAAREVRVWLGEYSSSGDELHMPDCELFWSLCQRQSPWWTRLWIIQECAYAAREPIIMLGAYTVSFQQLIERWQSAIQISSGLINTELEDVLTTNLKFLQMPFEASVNVTHRLPLSQRLRETTGRQCSDPHDKIYALLSLIAESEEEKLSPDYRKPLMDLVVEVSEVLRDDGHWDETRDRDLLSDFELEPCVDTALTRGKTLQQYSEALQEASRQGYIKVVKALLDRCADLVTTPGHIDNALQAASLAGHEKVAQMLMTAGADVNTQGEPNGNALYAASSRGHEKVVQMLLAAGVDIKYQGGHYGSALQAALFGGHEKVVQILLAAGAAANTQRGHYGSALQAASVGGYEKVVHMLLIAGADVNAQGGVYGNALYAASSGGQDKVVQILIAAGVDVNAQGGNYGDALYAASFGGHEKVVQILMTAGAGINSQGGPYCNALYAASVGGYEKIIQMLIAVGADVNVRGGHYSSALQAASLGGHEEIVQILIAAGADVNAQGGQYGDALYAASFRGHEKVVQVLKAAGAR